MDKLVLLVAAFVAEALVKNGVIPAPRTPEEADALLMLCAKKFVAFANAAVPVIEGCDGDCAHCASCPSEASDPNRRNMN